MWNVVVLELAPILHPEIVLWENDTGVELHLAIGEGEAGTDLVLPSVDS